MTDHQNTKLKIDKEFSRLWIPLPTDEYNLLKSNIIRSHSVAPITTWDGIILEGIDRYNICLDNNIDYGIKNVAFENRNDAILWICNKQLQRTSLSRAAKAYLIGHKILALRMQLPNSADNFIMKEYNISASTVYKNSRFAKHMDQIEIKNHDLFVMILQNRLCIPKDNIQALSSLSKVDAKRFYKFVLLQEKPSVTYLSIKNKWEQMQRVYETMQNTENQKNKQTDLAIKQMPAYDPNAGLATLVYTIPSWTSTIERIIATTDPTKTSISARDNASKQLYELKKSVDTIITFLTQTPKEDFSHE